MEHWASHPTQPGVAKEGEQESRKATRVGVGGEALSAALKNRLWGKGQEKAFCAERTASLGQKERNSREGWRGGYSLPGSSMDTLLPQLLREPLSSHLRREMKPR